MELDKLWLLERWFLILTNSCLFAILMYDVFLSLDKQQIEQKKAGKGYLRLKYEIISKVWLAIFISWPTLSPNNAAMRSKFNRWCTNVR